MPNIDLKVPEAGESIRSGILAKWYVKSGDIVKKDQLLYEFETEKITSEVLSPESGKIELQAEDGSEVQVGQVIAVIDTEVEVPSEENKMPESPKTKPVAAKATERKEAEPAVEKTETSGRTTRRPLTPIRQKIASQLVAAKNQTAMLTTFNEVDMSAVNKIRAEKKDAFLEKHGVKLGMLSFFTKAVVSALKAVPSINTQLAEDAVIENHYYDIGVAVSTDKGLLVPVIRDCDTASHADIERQVADLASRARTNKLTFADLEGGVFTITNGGVYGSLMSTPILNPPQCGILGLHAIKDRPIAVDGKVVIRPMMYIALSYDHRLVDGREAVTFLLHIKDYMENPEVQGI